MYHVGFRATLNDSVGTDRNHDGGFPLDLRGNSITAGGLLGFVESEYDYMSRGHGRPSRQESPYPGTSEPEDVWVWLERRATDSSSPWAASTLLPAYEWNSLKRKVHHGMTRLVQHPVGQKGSRHWSGAMKTRRQFLSGLPFLVCANWFTRLLHR